MKVVVPGNNRPWSPGETAYHETFGTVLFLHNDSTRAGTAWVLVPPEKTVRVRLPDITREPPALFTE